LIAFLSICDRKKILIFFKQSKAILLLLEFFRINYL
jgi:hypothetical protein